MQLKILPAFLLFCSHKSMEPTKQEKPEVIWRNFKASFFCFSFRATARLLTLSNSAVNVFIYAGRHPDFKEIFLRRCKPLLFKNKVGPESDTEGILFLGLFQLWFLHKFQPWGESDCCLFCSGFRLWAEGGHTLEERAVHNIDLHLSQETKCNESGRHESVVTERDIFYDSHWPLVGWLTNKTLPDELTKVSSRNLFPMHSELCDTNKRRNGKACMGRLVKFLHWESSYSSTILVLVTFTSVPFSSRDHCSVRTNVHISVSQVVWVLLPFVVWQ